MAGLGRVFMAAVCWRGAQAFAHGLVPEGLAVRANSARALAAKQIGLPITRFAMHRSSAFTNPACIGFARVCLSNSTA